MSTLHFMLLLFAGIAAGLSGSIASLASLFSYPALLSIGLSPATADVTNTVALVGLLLATPAQTFALVVLWLIGWLRWRSWSSRGHSSSGRGSRARTATD